MEENRKRVIWAVDPFGKDRLFQFKVAKALAKLVKGTTTVIEPVCVLSPEQLKVPLTAFSGAGNKEYRLTAEKILLDWIEKLKIPEMTHPRLLVQQEYSVRTSVRTIVDHARASHAELIGVGTHAKKSLHRFFIGSFAETLVLSADVPVFLVSPRVEGSFKTDRILFPTDFSDKSLKGFLQLIPLAKERGSKVILFHKVQFEVPPPIFGFDPTPVYREYLDQDIRTKRATGERWLRQAENQGLEAEVVFHEKPGYPVDAILSSVKKLKCGMIAMVSESGQAAALLLGSISRQVLRHAPCPVWILHPNK